MHTSRSEKHVGRTKSHTVSFTPQLSSSAPSITRVPSGSTPAPDPVIANVPVPAPVSTPNPVPAPASKEAPSSGGHFNFLAFRRAFTTRELVEPPAEPVVSPRPALVRQKSYFLEDHMSFKESTLKASDLGALDKILKDRVGLVTFRNFLKSVYAEENLKFWCDVVAFKTTTPPDQKEYEARKIYVLYIHEKASYPINVSGPSTNTLRSIFESQDFVVRDNLFDDAQSQAYDLLEKDCFPRFRKSPYFFRLQEGLDENFINQMVKKKTGLLKIFHT